jgi:predicted transcriptional regulator
MPKQYIPKTNYFSETRVQKMAKDVVKDCVKDRELALEAFQYFKEMVADNPLDDKAKAEMSKALDLAQGANDKVVKVIDLMLKMTQAEMKTQKSSPTQLSFEDLNK